MEAVKRKTASVISKIVGLLLAAVFISPVIILLLNVCKPLGEIFIQSIFLADKFLLRQHCLCNRKYELSQNARKYYFLRCAGGGYFSDYQRYVWL